jgi:hypothetical protein
VVDRGLLAEVEAGCTSVGNSNMGGWKIVCHGDAGGANVGGEGWY